MTLRLDNHIGSVAKTFNTINFLMNVKLSTHIYRQCFVFMLHVRMSKVRAYQTILSRTVRTWVMYDIIDPSHGSTIKYHLKHYTTYTKDILLYYYLKHRSFYLFYTLETLIRFALYYLTNITVTRFIFNGLNNLIVTILSCDKIRYHWILATKLGTHILMC